MAADENALEIPVRARLSDFQRAMGAIDARTAAMERKVAAEMRKIDQSTRTAARNMEDNWAKATVRIGGQMRSLRSFTPKSMSSMLGGAGGAIGAIGAGSGIMGLVGGFAAGSAVTAISDTAQGVADLRAEARRAGVDFEAFQRIVYGFGQARVSIDAVTDGMKELQLRADEFVVTGAGSGAEAFKRLGYNASELAEALKQPDQLLLQVMERMRGLDRAAQIRVADEIFGGTGGEQFVQALAEWERVKQAQRDAIVLTDEQADKAEEVNRKFAELEQVIGVKVKGALVDVGGAMVDLADLAGGVIVQIQGWQTAVDDFLKSFGAAGRLIAYLNRGGLTTDALKLTGLMETPADEQISNKEGEVQRLRDQLIKATGAVEALTEAGPDDFFLQQAQNNATRIADELERALAELEALKAAAGSMPAITVNPQPGASDAPASSAPLRTTRPDVDVAGLNADFRRGLEAFTAAAREAGHDIQLSSAFRSNERQAELYAAAVRRYGSEAAARRWVAPPGRSNHNYGLASDLVANGSRLGTSANAAATQWAHANAANYGLHFPLGNEDWHVEPQGPNGTRLYGARGNVGVALPQPADRTGITARREEEAREAAAEAKRLAEEQIATRERQAEVISSFNARVQEEIDLEKIRQEMLKAGTYTSEQINAALEQEAMVRATINERKQAGIAVDAAEEAAIRAKVAALYTEIGARTQLEAATDRLRERQENLKDAAVGFGEPIVDGLVGIIEKAQTAEQVMQSLLKQFARMMLQGALFGQGPLGGIFGGGLLPGLFKAPGRATGGPVSGGNPYLVGESGRPELFVPNSSGRIFDPAATQALVEDSVRPLPEAAGGGGITLHLQQSISLAGANGDAAIREASRAASERGARMAIAHVERNFGTIAKGFQRERG